jgi:NodT family efflux transporter outer membrane factor (OMF) lipoprotein
MKKIGLFLLALLIAAGACAPIGPDYARQDPVMPSTFGSLEPGVSAGGEPEKLLLGTWWQLLEDPVLDRLIENAVLGNPDLRIARARVQQARALAGISSSRLLPEGGPEGSYEVYRRSDSALPGQGGGASPTLPQRRGELYQVGFDASWEIDIFGGVRREIEAAQADLDASDEALRDVLVTLQGEVARNYVQLRGEQLRMAIARSELEARRTNVVIAEARFRAGLVSQLEWARAQGEVAFAESRIPTLETSVLAAVHRLGVLLGREPTSLAPELSPEAALPEIPDILKPGLPSDLLRQRPDIRKAEREVAAATARIGVSTADLFPRFSLTGSFGYLDDDLDSLSWRSGHYWRIGPNFRWPILNFKRILAAIDTNKAVRDESLARYEKVVLASLEEVENALVTLSREERRAEALVQAVQANDSALRLAQELYRAGAQSYLAVLDAETALYNAQDQLAQSRLNRALGFVSLYKALGGGWQAMEERPQGEASAGDAETPRIAVQPGG